MNMGDDKGAMIAFAALCILGIVCGVILVISTHKIAERIDRYGVKSIVEEIWNGSNQ